MMDAGTLPEVRLIPVNRIAVANPRARNRKAFREIVDNIAAVGLKRPITVAERQGPEGTSWELVCGQGRLQAFQMLGQEQIPAIVIHAGSDDCMVMSLVENLARRQHRTIDLLQEIQAMKQRGQPEADITRKTGLTPEYVRAVIRLLENGELRLLKAVDAGQIPVSVAVEIAGAADVEIQRVLQDAYEGGLLRGRKLLSVKRLIEQRATRGKGTRAARRRRSHALSAQGLLRAYKEDTERKQLVVRKAEAARERLMFVVAAVKKLLGDENFVTLLRAEGLDTLPSNLAARFGSTLET